MVYVSTEASAAVEQLVCVVKEVNGRAKIARSVS